MILFVSITMVGISALYDNTNVRYPIYHTGILTFVITVCIPMNLGLSRLPQIGMPLILVSGFVSLFMIVRNDKVGLELLKHLKIKKIDMIPENPISWIVIHDTAKQNNNFHHIFSNISEKIIITHDEEIDSITRMKLAQMSKKLQNVSRKICNL